MYLVDSSIWINHFRRNDPSLEAALKADLVVTHPFVIGELALGSLHNRNNTLSLLKNLRSVVEAENSEVLHLIETRNLHNRGLGFVDAHLLASTIVSTNTSLWTADKRLNDVASEFDIAGSHLRPVNLPAT